MSYPSIYKYWIEQQLPDGRWTTIDMKAGASTLEACEERLRDLRASGEPWSSRQYRIVSPERKPVEIPTK